MAHEAQRLAELEARNQYLEANLALYHDAVEHMHEGFCVVEPDGRIALHNSRYPQLLGLPESALRPGVTARDMLELSLQAGNYRPGMTADELEGDMWTAFAAGAEGRTTIIRGDRTYLLHPRRTAAGRYVATFEDITAQVTAEVALRDGETRLKAVLDALPDCVEIFAPSGALIHLNPKGLELLQAPDIESVTAQSFVPVPKEYASEALDVHRRVLAGETVIWAYEAVGMLGRRRHVEAHSVPFQMPDASTAHLCISRDIEERQQAHAAIQRSEERLRLVQDATGLADFEVTEDGVAFFNERFVAQTGLAPGTTSLDLASWQKFVHPDDRNLIDGAKEQSQATDAPFHCEFRIIRPDTGEIRWISSRIRLLRDKAGKPHRRIGAHFDITERKLAEQALRESEERFRLAAEAAGLGVWDFDVANNRREWSDRLREIFGVDEHAEVGMPLAEACTHPADLEKFRQSRAQANADEFGRYEVSFRIRRANDGAERWVTMNGWRTFTADQQMHRIIITVRDVTAEKTAEARVRWSATHDSLTKLANRSLFHERLDEAVERAEETGHAVGLLLLDMDHFKQINDSLGHDAGDMLLKMFAKRLRGVVRHCDTVARFGGDEFAVVLPDIDGEHTLLQVSRAIQQRLREPFIHSGRLLDCRVSIGASIFPVHGRKPEELIKNADIALYAAKDAGRGIVTLYEPHMRDGVQRRIEMIQLARHAPDDDRVIPYYQPKLDLAGRSIVGFEALLRWRTPNGRIGTPASLEAAFEEPDVAADISDRMIERVIADMRSWLDRGVAFQHVAVNASAAEFRRDNFAERVIEQLGRADIPTRYFQLEVTETVFLGRGAEYVHRALALLSMRGVKIALDDFGTGYASLRHLKQFPVDVIKIDQSFVRDMEIDPGDEAIVNAVISLGRSLGIKVVAEGIEHEAQARRLLELQCDFGQGYLFSRAVPARRVAGLIDRWPTRPENPLRHAERELRLVAFRE